MSGRLVLVWFFIILLGLAFVGSTHFGAAQTGTNVSGIISQNTTWTKTNSPYNLVGPVGIAEGVTLTLQAGVTVYINGYFLQVNGTLVAAGDNQDPVDFVTIEGTVSEINFMPSSNGWNETSGSGNLLENILIPSQYLTVNIQNTSLKLINSNVAGQFNIYNSSSIFLNNNIGQSFGFIVSGGSPIMSNNTFVTSITVKDGSPLFINNVMHGTSSSSTVLNSVGGYPYVSNNLIRYCKVGVEIADGVVQNNTFVNASQAILVQGPFSPTIRYNNILIQSISGGGKGMVLSEGASKDVDAAYNWWGTTDAAAINQSIHDFKDDFNLGNVSFVPFLTAPNPQASPNPELPISNFTSPSNTPAQTPVFTQSASPTSTPSPSIPEFPSWTILVLTMATLLVAVIIAKRNRAIQSSSNKQKQARD